MAHVVNPPERKSVYKFDDLEFGDWCEVHGRSTPTVSVAASRWNAKNPEKRLMVQTRHDGVVIVRRVL